jgi:hypothetical protein
VVIDDPVFQEDVENAFAKTVLLGLSRATSWNPAIRQARALKTGEVFLGFQGDMGQKVGNIGKKSGNPDFCAGGGIASSVRGPFSAVRGAGGEIIRPAGR